MKSIVNTVRTWLFGDKAPRVAKATHYDVADTNRENLEQWKDADCWDADKCNDPQSRQLARNRSRLETDNNPSLKGNVKTLVNYELGRGSTLHIDHDNDDFARDVEDNYRLWREATNHVGKFWSMIYARIQDGESFCRIGRNPNLRHPEDIDRPFPVQLDWQPFECDRCYTYWLPPYTPGRIDGVWYDDWGNPTYYDILRYHPGGVFPLGVIQYDTVPSQYIGHLFFPERPGQHRGVPEFASSIGFLGIRRRFTLATVEAAETAAKVSVYLKTNSPPGMEPDEGGAPMAMRIPRNSAWPLPQGWDISQVKPEHPGQTYESFSAVSLNEAMRPKAIPRNVALCDSSNYNMASGRLDITTLWESIGIDQRNNTWRIENPLFRAWYTEARRVYKTNGKRWTEIDQGTIPKRVFMWQRERYSDPEVQQGADAEAVQTGLRGIQDIYADRGLDWSRQQILNAKNLGLKDEPGGKTAVDQYLEWTRGNLTISKGGAPGPGGDQQGAGSGEGADGQKPGEPQEDTPNRVKAKFKRMFPGLAARLNGHFSGHPRKAKAAALFVNVPDIRQDTDYRCGAAAAMCVGKYFGVGPESLDDWSDELGTTAAQSTSPDAIVSYLSGLGLQVNARQNMSVDDLAAETAAGRPVIVCCQDYVAINSDPRDSAAEWDYGHWLTCLGVIGEAPDRFLVFQDSSEENMERLPGGDVPEEDEDAEMVVEEPGRRFVSERRWIPAWHDEAVDGVMYDQYGISVGLAERSTPSAALLETAAATIGGRRCARAADDGKWITTDSGTHIHLDSSGHIDKGPPELVNKTVDHLSREAHRKSEKADESGKAADHEAARDSQKTAGDLHQAIGNHEKAHFHHGEAARHDSEARKSSSDAKNSDRPLDRNSTESRIDHSEHGTSPEPKKPDQGESKMERLTVEHVAGPATEKQKAYLADILDKHNAKIAEVARVAPKTAAAILEKHKALLKQGDISNAISTFRDKSVIDEAYRHAERVSRDKEEKEAIKPLLQKQIDDFNKIPIHHYEGTK